MVSEFKIKQVSSPTSKTTMSNQGSLPATVDATLPATVDTSSPRMDSIIYCRVCDPKGENQSLSREFDFLCPDCESKVLYKELVEVENKRKFQLSEVEIFIQNSTEEDNEHIFKAASTKKLKSLEKSISEDETNLTKFNTEIEELQKQLEERLEKVKTIKDEIFEKRRKLSVLSKVKYC